jgi:hypothetical protein
MKVYHLMLLTVVCLLSALSISGQQTIAKKNVYQNVEIQKFTIREGVEFPADKIDGLSKSLANTLTRSKRFEQVSVAGEAVAPSESPRLRIEGEIIKYVKGNRAVRYMVGLGMGATKIVADVKFIDAATGEVVLQQTVDGDVTWGLFGGDSDEAKGGVADEIIRVMKKSGMAGEKKKTK